MHDKTKKLDLHAQGMTRGEMAATTRRTTLAARSTSETQHTGTPGYHFQAGTEKPFGQLMEPTIEQNNQPTTRPCSPFEEFFHLFAAIRDDEKLFPKSCKTCGNEYSSFAEYLCMTRPKGHVFEDCSGIMKRPFTMVYRHCSCGNTLVLTLTAETFPKLERFWSSLAKEASESGRSLVDVVAQFSVECDCHILQGENPCGIGPETHDTS